MAGIFPEWVNVVLASSAFGGVAGWVGARLAKRLDAKVDATHAADLERLRGDAAEKLQRVQTLETKIEARFAEVTSLETAAHVALLPRRVEAADKLWRIAGRTADRVLTPMGFFDVLTETEYPGARERAEAKFPKAKDWDEAWHHLAVLLGDERVEELRPFVSEELWQHFSAHRSFFGRVWLRALLPESRLIPWYKDSLAVGILEAAFPGAPRFGLYSARSAFDDALLVEIRRLLDGELASNRALTRAKAIEAAVTKANAG